MICPVCGTQCEENAKFCQNCGHNFTDAQPNPVFNAQVVNPAPVQESSTVLILGIVAMAVNAGLGCLCGCLGMLPGIVCAIVGLVLGTKEKKNYFAGQKNKKTEIGFILCIVALVLAVVISIVNAVLGAAVYSELLDNMY